MIKKKIIIGAWSWSGMYKRISTNEVKKLIKKCISNGFLEFDTSPSYKKADKILLEFKKKNSKTALYMTPAYVAPHNKASKNMTEKVQKLYEEAGDLNNSIVIPVGLSFKKAYEINPKIQLHKDDGSHPSVLGTYLAAATVFATLYGKSPDNNEYDHFGLIKPEELVFLQKVANDTVEEYFANLN